MPIYRSDATHGQNRLATINGNALIALDALLTTRSVSRAAAAMGVTQSTMSGTLARLRELFDDKLLVRNGRAMVPTPLAGQIRDDLRRGVDALERVLNSRRGFDPARSRDHFTIALNDRSEETLLPGLVRRLRDIAPGVTLQIVPWGHFDPPPGLANGSIDLSIGISASGPTSKEWPSAPRRLEHSIRSQTLFASGLTSIVRADHPGVGRRLTLKAFCALEHVLVTEEPRGVGIIDDALAKVGRSRRIALRVHRHALVARLVAETDLIATIGRRPAAAAAAVFDLRTFKPPVSLPPAAFTMMWHESTQDDAARRWLRARVQDIATDL